MAAWRRCAGGRGRSRECVDTFSHIARACMLSSRVVRSLRGLLAAGTCRLPNTGFADLQRTRGGSPLSASMAHTII